MISGIYKITNTKTNKVYIGSAVNIITRWYQHKTALNKNRHHSIKLQRSYNKHGKNNFIFEVIEKTDIDELILKEQHYIDLFDCYENGYNCIPTAGNNFGMKHTDETKEKLRKLALGNKNMLNKNHSDETKNKISEKLKGSKLSKETKKKMSESRKGTILTDETKIKISIAHTGKKLSENHKHKLSLAKLGNKQSQEVIDHRAKLNTGKKRTEESKKKISDKLKGFVRGPMSDEQKLIRSKKVALLSENGDIIKEFNSIKDCAKYIGSESKRISEVITGKKNHHKKFKFKLID